jgi:hypothetical protein
MDSRIPALILAATLHILVIAICAWDLWASWSNKPEASVSRIVAAWSKQHPALPLAVGFLAGHIWG